MIFSLLVIFLNFNIGTAQAQTNYSVRFYGNNTSYISVPVNQKNINVGAGDFTIEWWMKPTGVNAGTNCFNGIDVFTNGAIIIDRDIFGPGDYGDFGISLMNDRKVAFSVHNGSSGVTVCSSSLNLNKWYYLAAVKKGNTIKIYVNGIQTGSAGFSGQSNLSYRIGRSTGYPADPYFVFGAEKHTSIGGENFTAYHYKGYLDDLRISNIARNIVPIQTTFVADSNTVALFTFDQKTNATNGIKGNSSNISYSTDTPITYSSSTSKPTPKPSPTPKPAPKPNPTSELSNQKNDNKNDNPTPTPTPPLNTESNEMYKYESDSQNDSSSNAESKNLNSIIISKVQSILNKNFLMSFYSLFLLAFVLAVITILYTLYKKGKLNMIFKKLKNSDRVK